MLRVLLREPVLPVIEPVTFLTGIWRGLKIQTAAGTTTKINMEARAEGQ